MGKVDNFKNLGIATPFPIELRISRRKNYCPLIIQSMKVSDQITKILRNSRTGIVMLIKKPSFVLSRRSVSYFRQVPFLVYYGLFFIERTSGRAGEIEGVSIWEKGMRFSTK